GHFIKEVVEGGPAAESGLREGDRIIEVGGTNVTKLPHDKVVNQIKKSGNKVVLLVVDEPTYNHYQLNSDSVISSSRPQSRSSEPNSSIHSSKVTAIDKARLVHMVKASNKGYGFFLRVKKGEPGKYIGDVEKGRSAEVCSVMDDDRIVAINGHIIAGKSHQEVIELLKSIPNHVVLLLLGPAAERLVKTATLLLRDERMVIFLVEMKPRLCRLVKDSNGYGFFLRDENGHALNNIEKGGAADKAGVYENDFIIEVNGVNVVKDSHQEVVKKIQGAGDHVTFLVVNQAEREHFEKAGITISAALLTAAVTYLFQTQYSPFRFIKNLHNFLTQFYYFKYILLSVVSEVKSEDKVQLPRLCTIVKNKQGFGFHLNGENGGQYIRNVLDGGPADVGGVKNGDRVIEVNGVNISKHNHNDVVKMIKDSGTEITFLVVDKEADEYYSKKKMEITAKLLVASAVVAANGNYI
uniref:PDZ domain-containing protein n=1 Tax=Ciona savignyi TaxID=51511 RepID=H2Z7B9_CIOSA